VLALVDAGDEVVVPAPCCPSRLGMVRRAGGVSVTVPCGIEQGFELSPAQLAAAATARTMAPPLCSPANPTGAVCSAADLGALAEVLREHPQTWTISDDLYAHIVSDGVRFAALATVAPRLRERTLTVHGVREGWDTTGWRIGYAAGAIRRIFSRSTGGPCSVSQAAALGRPRRAAGRARRARRRLPAPP